MNKLLGRPVKESIDQPLTIIFVNSDTESLCNEFNNSLVLQIELRKQNRGLCETSSGLRRCGNSAYLPQMKEADVKMVVQSMTMAKPPSHCGTRIRDIVVNLDKLINVLLKIINSSLSSENLPRGLKIGVVIRPILKQGNNKNFSNC